MTRPHLVASVAAPLVVALAAGWGTNPRTVDDVPAASSVVHPLTDVGGSLVVAAGDIACPPGSRVTATTCRDAATAAQAERYHPRFVFALGDEQYQTATSADFRDGYAKTWGALRSITKPIPGNHEYKTARAAGYYTYFEGRTTAPGYAAFDVGGWRVYALNSNCDNISCSKENAWLSHDMTQHPRRCSALLMHHPLYSSGLEHGDSPVGRRFWVTGLRHHADLVLAGHDHDYERFRKMNASGHASRSGLTSFVVGTGGKSLYPVRRLEPGSRVYDHHRAGVLALRLGTRRFGWQFRTVDGRLVDQGIAPCT